MLELVIAHDLVVRSLSNIEWLTLIDARKKMH